VKKTDPSHFEITLTSGAETEATAPLPERERVGPYRLVRQIGEGGMGAVYLAFRDDDQYRKRAAVKLLRKGMVSDELLGRFRRERQILASLDHDRIARLLDGGATEDGLPYLVMEYVEGQPIDQYAESHKLSIRERLELFRAVCSAVHFAHQNLVVHRDLKPSNIMITTEGSPKLLDFGIAKLLNPELGAPSMVATQVELRIMTPAYASPEQIRGESITTASDVYSLGVLLYELLTGHRPYRLGTANLNEIAQAVCEQEPTRPSTVVLQKDRLRAGDVTARPATAVSVIQTREGSLERLSRRLAGDLDNIVLMAMRKEPQRRYASVERLSEDIRRHLEGLPVSARKDTFGYRAERFVVRHRAGVAAAGLVVLALIGGVAATAWQARIASAQRARAERALGDVRKLANAFIFDFHDAIEKLPGATAARELVVKRALEYLDRLAQEAPGDPTLQLELAAAYARVGAVQWSGSVAHLGQVQGALESQRKALAIREAVVRADPANASARKTLAASHVLVGDALAHTGKVEDALKSYRAGLAIRQELAAADPRDIAVRQSLAATYRVVGDTLGNPGAGVPNLGDRAAALESFRKMQEISESLATEKPHDLEIQFGVALGYERMADLLEADGDAAGALVHRRREVARMLEITRSDPTNARFRRGLTIAYDLLGLNLGALGDWDGALANHMLAAALGEEQSAADPADRGSRLDLAITLGYVGDALKAKKEHLRAATSYKKAVKIFEKLHTGGAEAGTCRQCLAEALSSLATTLAELGQTDEARSHARQSLELHRSQAQQTGATANNFSNYARQLLTAEPSDLRDPKAALPHAKRAVEMTQGKDADHLDTLALAYHINGDQEAAITTELRALDLVPARGPQRSTFEAALARFKASRKP
jgi:non-specific serine/threonine protein kinase/serine/threonine-protein kinase